MNVFILRIYGDRSMVYLESPRTHVGRGQEAAPGAAGGFREWWDRRHREMRAKLRRSKGGIGMTLKRLVDWLQRRITPDEPVLRALTGTHRIEIHYPCGMSREEAEAVWMTYLRDRSRYHLTWLGINGVLAPVVGVALFLVPGPNVLGFWFAYRAICHGLASIGTWRARKGSIPVEFRPSEVLDPPIAVADEQSVRLIASTYGLGGLRDFLDRYPSPRRVVQREVALAQD